MHRDETIEKDKSKISRVDGPGHRYVKKAERWKEHKENQRKLNDSMLAKPNGRWFMKA